MLHAPFVAPFFMEATLRFIDAAASLPGVSVSVISQDPEDRIPASIREKLAAHYRVADGLDPAQISAAIVALSSRLGPPHRLLGTLEQLQESLAEVRVALKIPGMRPEAAANFRDKARMKEVLRKAGIPCARHRLATTAQQAMEFARQTGLPLVVKPPAGAGARNTFRVDTPAALAECLEFSRPSVAQPILLEEFMNGEEHSFDSIFLKRKPVWYSISRYSPTPLEVLRNPWIQWCVLLPREIQGRPYDQIRDVAFRALEVLGMETGISHMEWFLRPDGSVAVSEVAARPPGAQFMTLISYAHDTDFYRAWARLMVLDEFTAPERKYACGAAFLRAQGAGEVQAVRGLEQAQQEIGSMVVESRMPRAGQAPSGTYEGDGYVILRDEQTSAVEQGLKRAVSMIRVEA